MNTHAEKTPENKSQSVSNDVTQKYSSSESIFQFVDNRPEVITQRRLQEMVNNSPQAKQVAQLQAITSSYRQGPTGAVIQKGKKRKKGNKEKREDEQYPFMNEFEYALPAELGVLRWVKDAKYFTENGWMSENLHLDSSNSAYFESESQLSIHAIIAIKKNGPLVRINPHVTVRDRQRQEDREKREERYLAEKKGYQKPKKTDKDKKLDKEDAKYSKQVGLRSVRDEKEGEPSKITTRNLMEVFTLDWVHGMAQKAIDKAEKADLQYKVGTTSHEL